MNRDEKLSKDTKLANQGMSDEKCSKCDRRYWVNFMGNYVCLNGCILREDE